MRFLLVLAVIAAIGAVGVGSGLAAPGAIMVRGFQTPESVLYDAVADVYLVSNINGNPTATDGNGFISRVSPAGTILSLKWIDGTKAGVKLNAPKGMAIAGNTLYIADITHVRMFNRRTGAYRGSIAIPGATFLNDAAAGPDGSVFITDSGLKPDFSPSGTDAVYKITSTGALRTLAKGPQLKNPNGVAVVPDGRLVVVTFTQTGEWYKLSGFGVMVDVRTLPKGQLDGVVVLPGGALLISSWGASAVYRVRKDGRVSVAVPNVKSPADIGYDARRNRVLIPLFSDNQVQISPVP